MLENIAWRCVVLLPVLGVISIIVTIQWSRTKCAVTKVPTTFFFSPLLFGSYDPTQWQCGGVFLCHHKSTGASKLERRSNKRLFSANVCTFQAQLGPQAELVNSLGARVGQYRLKWYNGVSYGITQTVQIKGRLLCESVNHMVISIISEQNWQMFSDKTKGNKVQCLA